MISGVAGFILNALSITILAAVVVIILISTLLLTDIWHRLRLSAIDRQRMLWLIVMSPWLIGVLATLIVVGMSQPQVAILVKSDVIHWHHLNEFYLDSWHGVLVLSMLLIAVLMIARVVSRLLSVMETVDLLEDFSGKRRDGVLELDSDAYAAFTAGIKEPNCYMTRALIKELDADEYDVIRIHEFYHVQEKDPARRAWFFVLAGLFPAVIARFLMSQMITATEQAADSSVVGEYPDRAFIARVLLKVHHLSKRYSAITSPAMGVCQFGADSIEQRIRYLLSDEDFKSFSTISVVVIILLFAVGCAMGADALHHVIELPWQH